MELYLLTLLTLDLVLFVLVALDIAYQLVSWKMRQYNELQDLYFRYLN